MEEAACARIGISIGHLAWRSVLAEMDARALGFGLFIVAACSAAAGGGGGGAPVAPASSARCGADGHPPFRSEPGSRLIPGQSTSACPKVEPANKSACPDSSLEWADTSAGRQRVGPSCLYIAPERGPCEFDSCGCELWNGPSKAPTWSCGPAME